MYINKDFECLFGFSIVFCPFSFMVIELNKVNLKENGKEKRLELSSEWQIETDREQKLENERQELFEKAVRQHAPHHSIVMNQMSNDTKINYI